MIRDCISNRYNQNAEFERRGKHLEKLTKPNERAIPENESPHFWFLPVAYKTDRACGTSRLQNDRK
jgi:hypothetical protein